MKVNTIIIARWLLFLMHIGAAMAIRNVHRINPYEKLLQNLHKEPNISGRRALDGEAITAPKHGCSTAIHEKWLEQQVDHFAGGDDDDDDDDDGSGNHTWMMRYYVNSEVYRPGGPIFIYVGGEWEITSGFLHNSHFYDMARQHGAIMFYTEHRYYGKSWPVRDASLENLQYLNVLQSLKDLQYFIAYQKSADLRLSNAKVVLVGGSYAGSMVTWFMRLYPNVANVAWASSAPLMAKMDFHEYMELAMRSIREKGGNSCLWRLQQAFKGLETALKSPEAYGLLQRLGSCSHFDVDNDMDLAALFNALGNYLAQIVQGQGYQITEFCNTIQMLDVNPTEALIKYFRNLYLPESEVDEPFDDYYCLDLSYGGMKSIFAPTGDMGSRCWFYQTCQEFGWFTTTTTTSTHTDVTSQFYGNFPLAGQVSLAFFHRLCHDVFGHNGNEDIGLGSLQDFHTKAEGINHIFGGLNNISQRVIFTHGLLDPWRAMGQQQGTNVLLIKDYSHVEDMGSIDLSDTVEMNVAKLKVAAFINKMLRQ